ncbi:MAG: uracil-DNA glycosylase [Oligoflexia bacterium]|nr:uracil-DNA glycosylase [Oligoflexia bacterium]
MTTNLQATTLQDLAELLADIQASADWDALRGAAVLPIEKVEMVQRSSRPAQVQVQAPAAPAPRPKTAKPPSPEPKQPAQPLVLGGRWASLAQDGGLSGLALQQALKDAVRRPSGDQRLVGVRDALGDCQRCTLCHDRSQIVFGTGDPDARLVVLGEAPGAEEDRRGEPFVGPAGAMLDAMLSRVLGLSRENVYILNMVKCRPPRNRNPDDLELQACAPFLRAQLASIRPNLVLLLGSVASRALLKQGITRARGQWTHLGWPGGRARMMATFHPAYLLRKPADKRLSFADLKQLRQALDALPLDGLPPDGLPPDGLPPSIG